MSQAYRVFFCCQFYLVRDVDEFTKNKRPILRGFLTSADSFAGIINIAA
jgi:hypothetical protein